MSVTQMFSRFAPSETSRLRQASAAAPAPEVTILTVPSVLPASSSALRTAAATMIAVPCWSSWKTGMPIRALQLLLDLEAFRRLDVFEVDAAEGRLERATTSIRRCRRRSPSISMSNTSMPANFLNRTALPSITGLEASGPILPRPSTAVPLVTTATRFCRMVSSSAWSRIVGDGVAGGGDAGRIGERQVALVAERLGRLDLKLARPRAVAPTPRW